MTLIVERNEVDRIHEQVARAFADLFCFVTVEHDFQKRQRFLNAVADETWKYRDTPAYDPRYADLEGNGFWLNVRRHGSRADSDERDMVANCAIKLWRDTRMADLFVDNRVLQDRESGFRITFDNAETQHVAGTLAYIGGAWVHPEFRRRGIAALLMAFSELHLIEHYNVDCAFGFIDDKAAEAGMGARAWRFHHHHHGVKVYWPKRGEFPAWLVYNTRADMLAELRCLAAKPVQPRLHGELLASA